jgi:hypothetical protein
MRRAEKVARVGEIRNGTKLWSGMLKRRGYLEELYLTLEGNINMDLRETGRKVLD